MQRCMAQKSNVIFFNSTKIQPEILLVQNIS